jgi:hypothetical protein
MQKPLEDTVYEDVEPSRRPEGKHKTNLVNKIWTFLDTTILVNPWATQVRNLDVNSNSNTFIPPGSIFIIQRGEEGGTQGKLNKTNSINLMDIPNY